MEVITKKITLNDFKNYDPNVKLKCLDYEGSECWNQFPMDLIVTNDELAALKNIPHVKKINTDGKEYTVLRYYNIKKLSLFFNEYERLMTYYRLIEIKGVKKWVKCEKPESFTVFTSLPSVEEFECGTYIATNMLHEQYLKYTGGGLKEIEITIKDILCKYFNNCTNDTSLTYDTPYINIPLYVSDDITDCGEMLNDLQKWSPSRHYYEGDVVFYNDEYYVAKKNISSESFEKNDWELLNLKAPSSSEAMQEVYTESKLNYFISQRRTYDDNGNVLPFILEDTIDGELTCLIYKSGYVNYIEKTDGTYVDVLKKVEYHLDNQWKEMKENENNMYIIFMDNNIINSGNTKIDYTNIDSIRFTFIIDAQVQNNEIVEGTGVVYEETRYCNKKELTCKINRKEKTFNYIDIEPLSVFSKTNNLKKSYAKILNISVNDKFNVWEQGVVYNKGDVVFDYLTNSYYRSLINKNTTELGINKYWELLNFSHLFVNDKLFGTSYVDVDLPKISIDRGNYTAMERHYILGEINSFDDLEKYRNNMFKL